jgi:YidC/Oxa1 family membrane protein insertase
MQKQQQEIMEFQQKEGYNPMAGCLPMLLQFPIIIFLYDIIRGPLSYIGRFTKEEIATMRTALELGENAVEFDIINKINTIGIDNLPVEIADFNERLSALPEFKLFGTNLLENPSFQSWTILIPVVAAALTWLSMYLSRKWNSNPNMMQNDEATNSSLKMMDLMMPGMTLFMAYGFQSLMGIYWIYQSALGILQTFIISKAMPLPKFSEEDVKEFKKAQKEAEKNARTAAKNAPKVRSLHYIDDDDYDNLPEIDGSDKNDKNGSGQMDIPEI